MGVEEVREYLKKFDSTLDVVEFPCSSATVDLAAEALGVDPDMIAKTMAFQLKDDAILIVLSGRAKINNRKFKEVFQQKAKMIKPDHLMEITGYPMGGVCPFALKQDIPVYLDDSLKKHAIIYPAGGTSNSAVKMEISQLERITRGQWVSVSDDR